MDFCWHLYHQFWFPCFADEHEVDVIGYGGGSDDDHSSISSLPGGAATAAAAQEAATGAVVFNTWRQLTLVDEAR